MELVSLRTVADLADDSRMRSKINVFVTPTVLFACSTGDDWTLDRPFDDRDDFLLRLIQQRAEKERGRKCLVAPESPSALA